MDNLEIESPNGTLHRNVARHWPTVFARLGDRAPAFFASVQARATRHGINEGESQARFLNLAFAMGPSFEDRPENEWALALLLDERLKPVVKLHQLVLRAAQELKRRGADAGPLLEADAAVLEALDAEGRARDPDAPPIARQACDIEAIDLRLIDIDWRQEYRLVEGRWQRQAVSTGVAPVRIDSTHPPPSELTVLTRPAEAGSPARLQLRQLVHGRCGHDAHPAARWLGSHGIAAWHGHEAKAVSWPVVPADWVQHVPVIAEETAPDVTLLHVDSCGLRDEGAPVGEQHLQLWAYPAHQWLWTMQRDGARETALPATSESDPPSTPTRCHIECDGEARSAARWVDGFGGGLQSALDQGLARVFEAWQQAAQQATLRSRIGVMSGRAGLTWGWREGPQGLTGAPLLRVVADLDLSTSVDLLLEGDVEFAGARSRVRLRCHGRSLLAQKILREQPDPPLLTALAPAMLSFRFPFVVEFDPLASDSGLVWSELGACTGAVVGEAGLRTRPSGGGWQWCARLAVEPVAVPVRVHDPVLGQTESHLALLGSATLLDWSIG